MKVILLIVTTADGMIARNSMQLVDWTGKADKKYFVAVTKKRRGDDHGVPNL